MGRSAKKRKNRKKNRAAGVRSNDTLRKESSSQTNSNEALILIAVSACFILSGFAALLYQTAWLRQFSIVFGTSELAVATVLAAYMAGLGGGAAVAGKLMHKIKRPVLVYGLLEGGIAVAALCVPFLLAAAGWLHVWALGGLSEPPNSGGLAQPFYYLVVSFLILAIPTGFMGATLPLLTRYAVHRNEQVGSRVALLYGINTLGAVLGTLTAAFVLLPTLGLRATVAAGAAVNLVVFLIAALLARQLRDASAPEASPATASAQLRRPSWILPLMLLSGANAFLYEVLWTRLLAHVMGGTVYAFATMLASFLTGIALGGLLAGRFGRTRGQATIAFTLCQLTIGILSAAVYFWLQNYVPKETGLAANVMLAGLVILPATLFVGATFPLAVRVLAESADEAPYATARTYAWNTVGAIVGSILAGFFLIPALGFEGAIRLGVGTNFLLAAAALLLVSTAQRRGWAVALGAVVAIGLYRPEVPMGLIDASAVDSGRGGTPIHYAVGRSATVFLKGSNGYFYLRTNGLPEAFIEPKGAPPLRHSQKWLTALPIAARPDANSMLIVGFGGGVAIEGVPPSVSDIDVIELEPEVIAANRKIGNQRRYNPLTDERVTIIENDARNALALTEKRYDVIVSQPSHPWTAGASHLYTTEFVDLAAGHLSDSGVFVQWINSLFVDEALLGSLTATLLEHFPFVRLYQPSPTILMFLASNERLDLERQILQTGRPLADATLHYSYIGINAAEDLLVALAADTPGLRRFAADQAPNTDDDNRMALFSRAESDGMNSRTLFELLAPFDPLLRGDSWVYDLEGINWGYLGERLVSGGFARRAAEIVKLLSDRSASLTMEGLGLRYQGRLALSARAFSAAVGADQSNQQARYAFIWPHLGRLAQGNAPSNIAAAASELRGSAGAVIKGWRLGIQKDWQGLADLDSELARARATDNWYPEAVKLRADWRIQGSTDKATNQEAMRILDRALMVRPLTDLLVIRAGAAVRTQAPFAFVETARHVYEQMKNKLDRADKGQFVLRQRDIDTMTLRCNGFLRQLESDFVADVTDRASAVGRQFSTLLARLAKLAPSTG